jgi:hypothetical protein
MIRNKQSGRWPAVEFRKELQDIRKAAARSGVTDLSIAMESFKDHTPCEEEKDKSIKMSGRWRVEF